MRWRALLLTAAVLCLLMIGILAGATYLDRGNALPVGAQARVSEYLAYAFPPGQVTVAATDRAAYPSHLTHDVAGASFGRSVHFQTDLGASDMGEGSLSPLPFPPAKVWCVLLEGEGPPAGRVILVAEYLDPYVGDWIVHEGPADASSVEAQHLLATLGCSLTPEPGDFNALDRAKRNQQRSYASIRITAAID